MESLCLNWGRMAVEVSGELRSMTSLTKLTFSRMEFMHCVSRRNTVSSRRRLTNSDFDGFKKKASMLEHFFMSSHTDLGSPAIVASSKYQTLKLDFVEEAMSWIAREKRSGPGGSPCCTPESDQIKFPLAIRGVGEPYANDASLKISVQFVIHLRRRTSRPMELKVFFMSSFARM